MKTINAARLLLTIAIFALVFSLMAMSASAAPQNEATCKWNAAQNSAAYQACLVTPQVTSIAPTGTSAPAASSTPKPSNVPPGQSTVPALKTAVSTQGISLGEGMQTLKAPESVGSPTALGSPTPTAMVSPTATSSNQGLHLGQTQVAPGAKGRSTWVWAHPRRHYR